MDVLLKVLAIYMYFNMSGPVVAYIYNENPKGYIASVNSINAFPKNRISSYRKYFRTSSYVNERLADRHVVNPHAAVPPSNVFAAVPARQSYISSIRHTQAPKRQMKDFVQNLKDVSENWKTESVLNPKNQTKLGETVNAKEKLFTPNRNLNSVQQESSRLQESLLSKRINNHISHLTKEENNKKLKLIPTNTQLLDSSSKILHKTNINERIPYAKSLSRVDTLQKYIDTLPKQGEYSKRDALKSKTSGIQYAQHHKKKFDVEKYSPIDWESTKENPMKNFEVVEGVLKPYAVFDSGNRDSFDSPTLLVQDSQSAMKGLAKLDNRHARSNSYIENIFLNLF